MNTTDRKKFEAMLQGFFAALAMPFKPEALPWWFDALEPHPIEAVREAMACAVRHFDRRGGGVVPAHVLAWLPSQFGHPSPEAAWNHLPKSEFDGGYVTHEMMDAYRDCADSVARGDLIGGRKAFLESYEARVRAAEMQRKHAVFFYTQPSEGNREQRLQLKETKTIEAVKNGWITQERGAKALALICDELAKPLPLALERIAGIVSGAKMPAAITSNNTPKALPAISAKGSSLMEAYGEIRAEIQKRAQDQAEAKARHQRETEERRRALLEQADAVIGNQRAG